MSSAELDALGRRIERLTVAPEDISAPMTGLLSKLFGSFLYRVGWQPSCRMDGLRDVLASMRGETIDRQGQQLADRDALMAAAVAELEDNVRAIERATVIERRALSGHARWLRRVYETLVQAERAAQLDRADARGRGMRLAQGVDDALLMPPLALEGAHSVSLDQEDAAAWRAGVSRGEARDGEGRPDGDRGDDAGPDVDATRILELQLDTVDHLLEAARAETSIFARKRRLLEAARQILLETSAALDLEEEGVDARLRSIARQVTRMDRMQALGLRADVGLLHQARAALSRGERDKLYAALQALDQGALAGRDEHSEQFASVTGAALEVLTEDRSNALARPEAIEDARREAVGASLARSAREVFGADMIERVERGFQRVREDAALAEARELRPTQVMGLDSWMLELFRKHITPGAERSVLSAALAVDGCFDLGGAASPVRVTENHIRRRGVPFPTQEMTLVSARGPEYLGQAVISDPRSVLLDLAAGRLLTRRYVRQEIETRERTVMQGEVRVYVVDGSTSMLGARAYMRDAILLTELATLMRRMSEEAHTTRLTLFYRYFTKRLGAITRIDNAEAALEAMSEIMENPRTGGTDIEQALLSSMETVREARAHDPDLARAQIVLITDGGAPVSERAVTEARAGIGESLPVGVSVIALGEENRALRKLVAKQRARGERAFYHFLPDEFLDQVARGEMDGDRPLHLPAVSWLAGDEVDAAQVLEERVGPLLEELADLEQARDRRALAGLRAAEGERGQESDTGAGSATGALGGSPLGGEGERAAFEAAHRDRRGLARRYARWFPAAAAEGVTASGERDATRGAARMGPEPGTLEHQDVESVQVLLATIAEVVELIETDDDSELARQADAIELLERMLPDARLSPARYHGVLATYPAQVSGLLHAVHAAVRWGAFWRLEEPHARSGPGQV